MLHYFQVIVIGYANLLFQSLEKTTEAEVERLTRNSKQVIDQLQATHANDLKALEKRLKIDEVMFLFIGAP